MEEYDIYEEENSEWIKGLQLVKEFSPTTVLMEDSTVQHKSVGEGMVVEPPKSNSAGAPSISDHYSYWEQHARSSPFRVMESKSHNVPRRSLSFDSIPPTPLMIESYLPTTHGVIRITFPSVSHPPNPVQSHDGYPSSSDPTNERISELVCEHLASYYHFNDHRSHSLPTFPTSATSEPQPTFSYPHPYDHQNNIISSTSSTTNISSQTPSPIAFRKQNNSDLSILLHSDSSDDEDDAHLKQIWNELHTTSNSNNTEEKGLAMRKGYKKRGGRPKKSLARGGNDDEKTIQKPSPHAVYTDEEESDEKESDPEEEGADDTEFQEEDSDDEDSHSTRKKRRRKNHSTFSDPPRRKASSFARSILMDWLVEHEANPYPTKRQKQELSNKTGLSVKQIVHWMSNIRKRRFLPLLSGRRIPTSNVDIKFLEEYEKRKNAEKPKK